MTTEKEWNSNVHIQYKGKSEQVDSRRSICQREMKSVVRLTVFFQNTTIHGLARIQNGTSLRKLYWAILFPSMFAILILNDVLIFKDFYSYPTYFKSEKSTMSSVPFPSVTLCNSNTFKKSDNNYAVDNTEVLINFLKGKNSTRGSNKISIADWTMQQSRKYFEKRNGNTTLINRNRTQTPPFLIEKL